MLKIKSDSHNKKITILRIISGVKEDTIVVRLSHMFHILQVIKLMLHTFRPEEDRFQE